MWRREGHKRSGSRSALDDVDERTCGNLHSISDDRDEEKEVADESKKGASMSRSCSPTFSMYQRRRDKFAKTRLDLS